MVLIYIISSNESLFTGVTSAWGWESSHEVDEGLMLGGHPNRLINVTQQGENGGGNISSSFLSVTPSSLVPGGWA